MHPPLFIVGAPRSGTTLLAAIFSAHPAYACGPETQFFNSLSDAELDAAIHDPEWPSRAIDALRSLTLAGRRVIDLFAVPEADLRSLLTDAAPGIPAMLEALTATFAARHGKPAWAEKTPNHLLHLDLIRSLYPNAFVMRILRDPRDSALSMMGLPWTGDGYLGNCYRWLDWYERSRAFFDTDTRAATIRYEDLVADPEPILRDLCGRIGIPFDPAMLHHDRAPDTVTTAAESWKRGVATPINTTRVARWRTELTPEIGAAAGRICHRAIAEFGYPDAIAPRREIALSDLDSPIHEDSEAILRDLAARGIVFRRRRPDDHTLPNVIRLLTLNRPRQAFRETLIGLFRLRRRLLVTLKPPRRRA